MFYDRGLDCRLHFSFAETAFPVMLISSHPNQTNLLASHLQHAFCFSNPLPINRISKEAHYSKLYLVSDLLHSSPLSVTGLLNEYIFQRHFQYSFLQPIIKMFFAYYDIIAGFIPHGLHRK